MVKLNHHRLQDVLGAVDWGFTNPGVIQVWAIDKDSRAFLVHEIYMTKRTIDWWIEQAKELQSHFHISRFVCDPAEPAFIDMFRQAGLDAVPGNNSLSLGIQKVQERLKIAGDGRPRLYILRDSLLEADRTLYREYPGDLKPVCSEQEFTSYVWPEGIDGRAVKEVPLDLYNHGMDAMRYMVMALDGATGNVEIGEVDALSALANYRG